MSPDVFLTVNNFPSFISYNSVWPDSTPSTLSMYFTISLKCQVPFNTRYKRACGAIVCTGTKHNIRLTLNGNIFLLSFIAAVIKYSMLSLWYFCSVFTAFDAFSGPKIDMVEQFGVCSSWTYGHGSCPYWTWTPKNRGQIRLKAATTSRNRRN